jgi:uncharacterized protein YifN (PemK superfamily)
MAIAQIVEASKIAPFEYKPEQIVDDLCENGVREEMAEALRDAMQNCFFSERFKIHFARGARKASLVRAGMTARQAEVFLAALEPSVVTPHYAEIRRPIKHVPGPGHVVMCNFNYLIQPEMQKERRAIVVSSRSSASVGRCTVVPVSMSAPHNPNPHYHEFRPGAYPFFHSDHPVWAVCDHVYTVSIARLWMVNVNRRPQLPQISEADLRAIRTLLGTIFGMSR